MSCALRDSFGAFIVGAKYGLDALVSLLQVRINWYDRFNSLPAFARDAYRSGCWCFHRRCRPARPFRFCFRGWPVIAFKPVIV